MRPPRVHGISITRLAVHWEPPFDDAVGPHTFELAVWLADTLPTPERAQEAKPVATYTRFGRECVVTGLLAGESYHLLIRAKNLVGWGPWSEPTLVRTLCT